MKKSKLFLSVGIIFAIILFFSVGPIIYFYLRLPTPSEIRQGVSLNQLFSNFEKKYTSNVDSEISQTMVCLSCITNPSSAATCSDIMASYISKNLANPSQRMIFWHLQNLYITKTISIKYSEKEIQNLHYSFLANIFNEKSINSLCQNVFKKECSQLDRTESIDLERVFLSGKLPPPKYPPEERFDSCFPR